MFNHQFFRFVLFINRLMNLSISGEKMRNQEAKKNDRRTQYTRKVIKEAFLDELSKKNLARSALQRSAKSVKLIGELFTSTIMIWMMC